MKTLCNVSSEKHVGIITINLFIFLLKNEFRLKAGITKRKKKNDKRQTTVHNITQNREIENTNPFQKLRVIAGVPEGSADPCQHVSLVADVSTYPVICLIRFVTFGGGERGCIYDSVFCDTEYGEPTRDGVLRATVMAYLFNRKRQLCPNRRKHNPVLLSPNVELNLSSFLYLHEKDYVCYKIKRSS